ncbi:MAG: lactoylglutathione lyase [Micrococcus sp.]|nr:lactoylglutathione lyase [Micrococcus sp.]
MALFSQPVFLNLPTTNTERIRAFWTDLGADILEEHSDDESVCVNLTGTTYALYMSAGAYTDYIGEREIADCITTNSSHLSLVAGDAAAVDALADRALSVGGSEVRLPKDLVDEISDSGMHSREIVDPDGHQWEFVTA